VGGGRPVKEGSKAFMAKDQGATPTTFRPRSQSRGAAVAEPPKKPFNLVQFYREVRAEARKVTWTSWKETWITSVMVGIMVVVTALFFFAIDGAFGVAMNFILKLGTAGQ
jgi:preprotein translocase subunit SecE